MLSSNASLKIQDSSASLKGGQQVSIVWYENTEIAAWSIDHPTFKQSIQKHSSYFIYLFIYLFIFNQCLYKKPFGWLL